MPSINYQGKEYNSKAEVIRELYQSGKLTFDSNSKKQIAQELGITVQTVHATLVKLTKKHSYQVESIVKDKKSEAVIITDVNNKKDEEVGDREIELNWAPNQWGLPVTNPPLKVKVGKNFKGDIYLPDENNQNSTGELIEF